MLGNKLKECWNVAYHDTATTKTEKTLKELILRIMWICVDMFFFIIDFFGN